MKKTSMKKFVLPSIMSFTVMPYRLTVRAWLDPIFEDKLIQYPKAFLLEVSSLFPRDKHFIVLRDTPAQRHFVLPHLPARYQQKGQIEVEAILAEETGEENYLREFLPAEILSKALFDSEFKSSLIRQPNKAIESLGYSLAEEIIVVENSETVNHIPLRYNNVKGQDIKELYKQLEGVSIVAKSSKCCASGTCS